MSVGLSPLFQAPVYLTPPDQQRGYGFAVIPASVFENLFSDYPSCWYDFDGMWGVTHVSRRQANGKASIVPAAHWWLSGNVKLGLIWGSVVHCDVFVLVCCAFCMLGNVHLMFLEVLDTHLVKVQGGGYFFWRRLS